MLYKKFNNIIYIMNNRIKYKFNIPNTGEESTDTEPITFFYQICTFPDPYKKISHEKIRH